MLAAERMCSDEVELKNGKSNPFGWSQYELWHNGEQIGWLESGAVDLTHKDYRFTKTKLPDGNTRVDFFVKLTGEEPLA